MKNLYKRYVEWLYRQPWGKQLKIWDEKMKAKSIRMKADIKANREKIDERKRSDALYNHVSLYLNLKAASNLPAKKEYRNLSFNDTAIGKFAMEKEINNLASRGWKVSGMSSSSQGYNVGKTIVLASLFLPLGLAGKKSNKISIIMERDGEDPNIAAKKAWDNLTHEEKTQAREREGVLK